MRRPELATADESRKPRLTQPSRVAAASFRKQGARHSASRVPLRDGVHTPRRRHGEQKGARPRASSSSRSRSDPPPALRATSAVRTRRDSDFPGRAVSTARARAARVPRLTSGRAPPLAPLDSARPRRRPASPATASACCSASPCGSCCRRSSPTSAWTRRWRRFCWTWRMTSWTRWWRSRASWRRTWSDTLEVKDIVLHLERAWDMVLPGFETEELREFKPPPEARAHKRGWRMCAARWRARRRRGEPSRDAREGAGGGEGEGRSDGSRRRFGGRRAVPGR